jgi:hypothetical protein
LHSACRAMTASPTEDLEQRFSYATTATPRNFATPWVVLHLGAATRKGAAASNAIRTADAMHVGDRPRYGHTECGSSPATGVDLYGNILIKKRLRGGITQGVCVANIGRNSRVAWRTSIRSREPPDYRASSPGKRGVSKYARSNLHGRMRLPSRRAAADLNESG